MTLSFSCDICQDSSAVSYLQDLVALHVSMNHPGVSDPLTYVKGNLLPNGLDLPQNTEQSCYGVPGRDTAPIEMAYAALARDVTPTSLPYLRLYPVSPARNHYEISEVLALVAFNASGQSGRRQHCEESLGSLLKFETFSKKSTNIARLLAESYKYRENVLRLLKTFGYPRSKVRFALEDDDAQIAHLLKELVVASSEEDLVQSLCHDPAQSEGFLNLIERVLATASHIQGDDSVYQDNREAFIGRSKDHVFRSKIRRISNKLSEASETYRGTYAGMEVAVKRLHSFVRATDEEHSPIQVAKTLCHEALVWRHLDHPNILPLLGVDQRLFPEDSVPCLVSPWVEAGNVHDYITAKFDGKIIDQELHRLLKEIICGLSFLHAENIVHGDLRGSNVLIDNEGHVLLSDYGLAVHDSWNSTHPLSPPELTPWLAPELLDPEAFGLPTSRPTYVSDIYGYACVSWELLSGLPLFYSLNNNATRLANKVLASERPPRTSLPRTISDSLWRLVQSCWQQDPESRPAASTVRTSLQRIGIGASTDSSPTGVHVRRGKSPRGLSPLRIPGRSPPGTGHLSGSHKAEGAYGKRQLGFINRGADALLRILVEGPGSLG
ncbi:hypothetical protein EW026_g4157 [Hermanssonia centrifuga]|uniref:Protein kinase domain-containing protein n=1 Tax=Hermanssonia centrifuga TaxID=98765 RepID=A0A4S4KI28_9APHY|nr:hypothetical protein EW026_g4157 [Hermanssonia centrifuga]